MVEGVCAATVDTCSTLIFFGLIRRVERDYVPHLLGCDDHDFAGGARQGGEVQGQNPSFEGRPAVEESNGEPMRASLSNETGGRGWGLGHHVSHAVVGSPDVQSLFLTSSHVVWKRLTHPIYSSR